MEQKYPKISGIAVRLSDCLVQLKLSKEENGVISLDMSVLNPDRSFIYSRNLAFSNLTDFFEFCKGIRALERYEQNKLGEEPAPIGFGVTDVPEKVE